MKEIRMVCCSMLLLINLGMSNEPHDANAVDLFDAYQIAFAEAIKWDEDALPYFITSVDDRIEDGFVKGGGRKATLLEF